MENYQDWSPCQVHGHHWASEIDPDVRYPDHCTDCGEERVS